MNFTSHDSAPADPTDAALRRLAQERAPILQQISEGVIIAATDGKLVFVNQAAERLHGVKTLDVAPDHYSDTYHLFTMEGEVYPFSELPLARAVNKGDTVEDARWRIRRPDGSEIVAIGSARPLTEGGRQIGAILSLRDDSERFEAERRVRESEAQLRLALDTSGQRFLFGRPGRQHHARQPWLSRSHGVRTQMRGGRAKASPDHPPQPSRRVALSGRAMPDLSLRIARRSRPRSRGSLLPARRHRRYRSNIGSRQSCATACMSGRSARSWIWPSAWPRTQSCARAKSRFRNMADRAPGDDVGHRPGRLLHLPQRPWYEFTGQDETEGRASGGSTRSIPTIAKGGQAFV